MRASFWARISPPRNRLQPEGIGLVGAATQRCIAVYKIDSVLPEPEQVQVQVPLLVQVQVQVQKGHRPVARNHQVNHASSRRWVTRGARALVRKWS